MKQTTNKKGGKIMNIKDLLREECKRLDTILDDFYYHHVGNYTGPDIFFMEQRLKKIEKIAEKFNFNL